MNKICVNYIKKNNIFFKNKQLNLSQYEMENIKILKKIFENQRKINLLITPDKEIIEILSLLILSMKLYIKNLEDKQSNILDYLNIGDIVVYEGKKVKYMGIEKIYNDKKIKLRYDENSTAWIKLDDYYKLSIYRGNSKKLNIMSNKKSNKKNSKYILADMLDMNLEDLTGVVEQQMVVVYPSKKELENLLSNIKIRCNGKKYYFTEIFPCKYYSSIDNSIDFKGNKLKLKELLIFTSNLSVAKDLIQEDKERSNLLLLGEDTYANEIDGELDSLLYIEELKKVYILNTFDKSIKLSQLIEGNFDIQLNAWTKAVFLQKLNQMYLNEIYFKDKTIYSFLNRKVENKLVDYCKNVTKKLLKLKKKLLYLSKDDFYCNDQKMFFITSYGLLKIFEKGIVPIKEYDEFVKNNNLNKYTINELIKKLESILKENEIYDDCYTVLESTVELVKDIKNLLYYKNPKLDYVKTLNLSYDDLIFCSNSVEQSILEKYEFIKNKAIIVGCVKDYKFHSSFRKIVFTGVYQSKNIEQIHCYNGLNIINLLYPSEIAKYNFKVNRFNKLSKLIEENNNLGSSDNLELLKTIKMNYDEFIKEDSSEDIEKAEIEIEKNIYNDVDKSIDIKDFESDFDIEELLNISFLSSTNRIYSDYTNSDVKKYIEFKDGKGALLTQFYRSKCLYDENKNIVEKDISSLKIGDKLIFLHDRTENEITELFYKIMNSDKFKKKYNNHYYNMKYWKNILKKYVYNYFEDYSLVVAELSLHGINKTEQAIRTWILDENIIGPREKKVYKALADITNDNYFLETWEEIYESCTLIRSLKTKLKKNFNQMVIKSVVNQEYDSMFENLVYSVLADLKQYAQIEKIERISNSSMNVPTNKTNCVLEKEILYEFLK